MDEKKSLEQNILQEVNKTGFPTEIVSSTVMQACNWEVTHNPSYLDESEMKSREFDILSYKGKFISFPNNNLKSDYFLITECKKSEKPWVFFTTDRNQNRTYLGEILKYRWGDRNAFSERGRPEGLVSDDELREFHHYFKPTRLARTFFEPFKKKEHAEMIYSAVISVVKATLFHLTDRTTENCLRIYNPLIIFSGNLFEAQVDSKKGIELKESQHIQLSFHYMIPQKGHHLINQVTANHREFIIDIVREDYLFWFLQEIETEHNGLINILKTIS